MKREREPTQEEFNRLLAWLGSDRDVAAAKYETIRSALIRIFISRGCIESERLADETLNRVTVRIDKVVDNYSEPGKCFRGFADNVYREHLPDRKRWVHRDPFVIPDPPDDENEQHRLELEDRCLRRCMGGLSSAEDDLFRRYCQEQTPEKIKIRKKLAQELGLTSNALALKVCRVRTRLRKCMIACLDEAGDE